jgi:hypothetical protein
VWPNQSITRRTHIVGWLNFIGRGSNYLSRTIFNTYVLVHSWVLSSIAKDPDEKEAVRGAEMSFADAVRPPIISSADPTANHACRLSSS